MKSKILSSRFKNVWGEGQKQTFYHELMLEGEDRPVSIGAKQENPPFLQAGGEIEWEWYDETKRSIKKAQAAFGGKGKNFVDTSNTQIITAAMTNTVALLIAGTIQIEDIGAYMKRLTDVAVGIKKELV